MTPLVDPYAVLGVTSQASQEEINSAYRRLVRLHHPDARTGGACAESAAALERVLAAYAMLRDPQRRAEYDRRHPPTAPAANPRPSASPTMPSGMIRMTFTIRVQPRRRPNAA